MSFWNGFVTGVLFIVCSSVLIALYIIQKASQRDKNADEPVDPTRELHEYGEQRERGVYDATTTHVSDKTCFILLFVSFFVETNVCFAVLQAALFFFVCGNRLQRAHTVTCAGAIV